MYEYEKNIFNDESVKENPYKVNLPEGESGDWRVKKIVVDEEAAKRERFRAMMNGGRHVPEGEYTGIYHKGYLIMSDTPNEISDHMSFIRKAEGHVLINGLGIGMVLQAVIKKPEVTHVTVVEFSEDVIALTGKVYKERYGDKLTIIHADALEYKPPKGERYGAVWHDIWGDICADNLEDMKKLHRKYGRRTDWQGSWCRGECERQRDYCKRNSWW